MSREKYYPPRFRETAFHCPMCNVKAQQLWNSVYVGGRAIDMLMIAQCSHCRKSSFWINKQLVFPRETTAPPAHEDMPESVLEYYNEARDISDISPRSAAALLRIATKKLCEHLGENEPNLNHAIGNLHKRELPQSVIKSLDTVRIVGNEGGAHEGQIDLTGEDNKEVVDRLFWLINFIVEKTISDPKQIDEAFSAMPEDKRRGVKDRDKPKG